MLALLRRAGLSPREVLSLRSRAYRELGLAERDLGDDELIELMVQEPALLKRPIVVSGRGAVVGFKRDQLAELIQAP